MNHSEFDCEPQGQDNKLLSDEALSLPVLVRPSAFPIRNSNGSACTQWQQALRAWE